MVARYGRLIEATSGDLMAEVLARLAPIFER